MSNRNITPYSKVTKFRSISYKELLRKENFLTRLGWLNAASSLYFVASNIYLLAEITFLPDLLPLGAFALIPFLNLVFSTFGIRRMYLYIESAKNTQEFEPLPPKFALKVNNIINNLQKWLPLDNYHINVLYNYKDFTSAPCVIAQNNPVLSIMQKDSIDLILPLGFFKVLRMQEQVAEAMVAHELSHIIHKDTHLLHQIRAFLDISIIFFSLVFLA